MLINQRHLYEAQLRRVLADNQHVREKADYRGDRKNKRHFAPAPAARSQRPAGLGTLRAVPIMGTRCIRRFLEARLGAYSEKPSPLLSQKIPHPPHA